MTFPSATLTFLPSDAHGCYDLMADDEETGATGLVGSFVAPVKMEDQSFIETESGEELFKPDIASPAVITTSTTNSVDGKQVIDKEVLDRMKGITLDLRRIAGVVECVFDSYAPRGVQKRGRKRSSGGCIRTSELLQLLEGRHTMKNARRVVTPKK